MDKIYIEMVLEVMEKMESLKMMKNRVFRNFRTPTIIVIRRCNMRILRWWILGIIVVSGFGQTIVYIDPPRISPRTIGAECTLKVRIKDGVNVFGWNVGLSYDPNILKGINVVVEDSFLKYEDGLTHSVMQVPGTFDSVQGILSDCASTRLGSDSSKIGDGSLIKVVFKIKATGNSEIKLRNVQLMNDYNPPYNGYEPFISINGYYGTEDFPPTSSFLISSGAGNQIKPVIAYNNSQNEFLVVWEAGPYGDIYGQRISSNGSPIGNNFPISASGLVEERSPAICWSGQNYLVVYEKSLLGDSHRSTNLYGRLIQPNGSVGNEFLITDAPQYQGFPSIGWNGINYMVVWQDLRNYASSTGGLNRIYGRLINPTGSPVGSDFLIDQYYGGYCPKVISNGDKYFVIWTSYNTYPENVYGRLINADGSFYSSQITISQNYSAYLSDIIWNGTNFLAVWASSYYSGDCNIFGRRISSTGELLGSEFNIVTGTGNQTSPRVDWENGKHRVIFVNENSLPSIWRQAVNPDGSLFYDPSLEVDAPYYQIFPDIEFGSANPLIVWADFRNGTYYQVYGSIPEIIGIDEKYTRALSKVAVYPNPAQSYITIVCPQNGENARVSIYNINGCFVNSLRNTTNNTLIWDLRDINGNLVEDGIYFVVAKTRKFLYTQKIIISK
uniref:T9SS type A sorting domain-containing protein n=1 Tax=candidate division WOR-3 bacterium TaxID=2052148 RepID=A0A7V3RGM5_UNCW3